MKTKKPTYKQLLEMYEDVSKRYANQVQISEARMDLNSKLQKEAKDRIFEKHHDEISKILSSLAVINESVSKAILSINGHL